MDRSPMQPPSLLEMIGTLVAEPSVSSAHAELDMGNRGVIDRLGEWLEGMGFAVEIMPLEGNKANLLATLGAGEDALVLAGHTDTVPWDEGAWKTDPFRLSEREGRLYGLGTADMKAFLALAIEAARALDPARMQHPLVILATADEETSMSGARALLERGSRPGRYAVIGEPTGLRPVRQHKGILMEAIRLRGRSGHSSDPAQGINALEGMAEVMQALLALRAELAERYHNPDFAVPVPTLNLGHIHGGDNPNRICGECELHIDLRPLPGMSADEARTLLRARLVPIAERRGLKLDFKPLFHGIDALQTASESWIVQTCERLTGERAGSVAFGTEGPYLQALGTETVILGPGDIEQAHQPDEFLALERIPPMLEILRALIRRHCLGTS
ncbi:MAG: acetylornithine deacetylase [Gammaproteobacteria bacterium]|nr:MAG: acetylornithine deacetylase [Gammaproteobacteria bacterium]